MIKKHSKHHNKKGSLLVLALIAIFVGISISASLLKYTSFNNILIEKETGNIKCSQAIKLANRLYLTAIQNTPSINQTEIEDLQKRIGGGSSNPKTIFGYSTSNAPSEIPGFRQIGVDFKGFNFIRGTVLQTPDSGNGFNYFEDVMGQDTTAIINDTVIDDVPAFLENTKAVVSEKNTLEVVPVFNMLAFYDRDLEFFAEEQGGFFSGRIHTNGNLYLVNLNKIPGTEMTFHGKWGASILSAHGNVFRRGRGGLESTFWPADGNSGSGINADAHMGMEFHTYSDAAYAGILDVGDFNVNKPNIANTITNSSRVLTPDYTTYVHSAVIQNASYFDHLNEANARRHAGNHEDFGCRFTQISKAQANAANPFIIDDVNGDPYGIIIADAAELAPPVNINPYQYVEDIQYTDIPDTINYAAPIASNYSEDADRALAENAFNSTAALVIRDGVVYQRSVIGGDLSRVLCPLEYPDTSHPDAKKYADLRWYGWFGMYDGVNPTTDNPARWHFPIKSVTLNKTNNTTSSEGSASAFTFRSATVHNPKNDGVSSGTASWIRTDIDMSDLTGYPGSNTNNGNSTTDGAGVGMWNSSYNTLRTGVERYDPVRIAYDIVKAEVRKLYNQNHIYTSRYGVSSGIYKMLNKNGSDPGNNIAPDVWGAGADKMQDSFGVDYDNADGDYDSSTGRDYSAFWNDDGAIGPIGAHRYWRILVLDNGGGNQVRITEMGYVTPSGAILPTSSLGNYDITESSMQNVNMDGAEAFDNDTSTNNWWQSLPNQNTGWLQVSGKTASDKINPVAITMTMDTNAANGAQNAPKDFNIEYSDDGVTWTSIAEIRGQTWAPSTMLTISISQPKSYKYIRDPDNVNTYSLWGHLTTEGAIDTTPKIELFPIRHKSLIDTSINPNSFYEDINTFNPPTTRPPQANCIDSNRNNDWYIYKSTLPLSDRTLPMPLNRTFLIGYDEFNNRPLSSNQFLTDWYNTFASTNLSVQAHKRIRNFGYNGDEDGNGEHNWYTLLNNAPEMLVRQRSITHEVPDTTISSSGGAGFSYIAGDIGGYYGNDNLCMIDNQEKKIVAFTELDLAEFTDECFRFNGLTTNFATNNVDIRSTTQLQNVIYITNTTMGRNFYGKRVHCGAVRLKRGALLQFPLSIASPNSVYVWGDYNSPGYFHHGPKQTDANVGNIISYNVPTTREHDTGTIIKSQPAAIYADAIQIIENNSIPFDQTDANRLNITQANNGALNSNNITWNLGYTNAQLSASKIWPGNPTGHDFQNSGTNTRTYLDFTRGTHFDHELWWEDDGLRIAGGSPNADGSGNSTFNDGMKYVYLDSKASPTGNRTRGTQLYINYHELHFDNGNHLLYNILQRYIGGGNPIMKIMPQAIIGGFFYGNVEGRSPSVFTQTDVTAITASKPSSVSILDWLTSWIPRVNWVELSRNNLMDLSQDCTTVGNGSISASEIPAGSYLPSNLSTGNFYGFNADSYVEDRFELLKKRFGNIGFKLDIRSMHTYHWPVFADWATFGATDRQNYTRNFIGAFSCLFDSRQATHEQREKDNSWEGRSMYCFNPEFENPDGLPPGTPLVTNLGSSRRTIGGTKWTY